MSKTFYAIVSVTIALFLCIVLMAVMQPSEPKTVSVEANVACSGPSEAACNEVAHGVAGVTNAYATQITGDEFRLGMSWGYSAICIAVLLLVLTIALVGRFRKKN